MPEDFTEDDVVIVAPPERQWRQKCERIARELEFTPRLSSSPTTLTALVDLIRSNSASVSLPALLIVDADARAAGSDAQSLRRYIDRALTMSAPPVLVVISASPHDDANSIDVDQLRLSEDHAGRVDAIKGSDIEHSLRLALEGLRARRDVDAGGTSGALDELIGGSPTMTTLKQQIARMARFLRVDRSPRVGGVPAILLVGETGTGKELVARALHALSPRANEPFKAVNASTFPGELIASELFGHRKGAFTGAAELRRGVIKAAKAGVLFLDEIDKMDLAQQGKLMRAISPGRMRAVGADEEEDVLCAIVASASRPVAELKTPEAFREDLFYRLVRIEIPPLRERKSDVGPLVAHFLGRLRARGGAVLEVGDVFSVEALALMTGFGWPGNVRQLETLVQVAYVYRTTDFERPLSERDVSILLSADEVAQRSRADSLPPPDANLSTLLEAMERCDRIHASTRRNAVLRAGALIASGEMSSEAAAEALEKTPQWLRAEYKRFTGAPLPKRGSASDGRKGPAGTAGPEGVDTALTHPHDSLISGFASLLREMRGDTWELNEPPGYLVDAVLDHLERTVVDQGLASLLVQARPVAGEPFEAFWKGLRRNLLSRGIAVDEGGDPYTSVDVALKNHRDAVLFVLDADQVLKNCEETWGSGHTWIQRISGLSCRVFLVGTLAVDAILQRGNLSPSTRLPSPFRPNWCDGWDAWTRRAIQERRLRTGRETAKLVSMLQERAARNPWMFLQGLGALQQDPREAELARALARAEGVLAEQWWRKLPVGWQEELRTFDRSTGRLPSALESLRDLDVLRAQGTEVVPVNPHWARVLAEYRGTRSS